VFFGFAFAFFWGWKLTLILFGALPVLGTIGVAFGILIK